MKQRSNITTNQTDVSTNSPPQKRAKKQPDRNAYPFEATSDNFAKSEAHLTGDDHLNQEPTNPNDTTNNLPLKDGIHNFFLPSEEFGTSLRRSLTLLKLGRDHCLDTWCAQRKPKKRF